MWGPFNNITPDNNSGEYDEAADNHGAVDNNGTDDYQAVNNTGEYDEATDNHEAADNNGTDDYQAVDDNKNDSATPLDATTNNIIFRYSLEECVISSHFDYIYRPYS